MIGSSQEDRNSFFKRFDSLLFGMIMLLTILSIFAVYSAGIDNSGVSLSIEWIKQIIWVVSGFILYVAMSRIDYDYWRTSVFPVYVAVVVLLILVLVIGTRINGAKRWLGIGVLGIQPSEAAKAVAVLALASYWDARYTTTSLLKKIITSFALVMPFVVLILVQPDTGSAISFLAFVFIMLFFTEVSISFILFVVLTMFLTVFYVLLAIWQQYITTENFWLSSLLVNPETLLQMVLTSLFVFVVAFLGLLRYKKISYSFIAFFASINVIALFVAYLARLVLKPYQASRLITFIDPNYDAQGAGYQVLQSLIAVGNGGLWGKGYLQGNHSHLRYLPEQSTDFIFSIILEEFGFVGGIVVVGLYVLILMRLLFIAGRASSSFGSYLCYGTFAIIFFHTMVNMGMVIGLLPITGIPLLLLSYGGTSVWMIMALLGVCNSVYIRRYKN